MRFCRRLVFGFVSLQSVLWVTPIVGAENTGSAPLGRIASAWSVNCANSGQGSHCRASQVIRVRKTGGRLLGVEITMPWTSDEPAMLLHLPHGLYLPAGTTVRIDEGKPEKLVVRTCKKTGCFAGKTISPQQLDAMKSGKVMTVSFQNLTGKDIAVQVSLVGFAEALEKIKN